MERRPRPCLDIRRKIFRVIRDYSFIPCRSLCFYYVTFGGLPLLFLLQFLDSGDKLNSSSILVKVVGVL